MASKKSKENKLPRISRQLPAMGKNYRTKHYNLDAIIAVGYRVKVEYGAYNE
jgi:hypothetical protein